MEEILDMISFGGRGYSPAGSASFRGVTFGVIEASDSRGRKTVIHEFPLRDEVCPEDLGRAKRTINLTGFLVGADYHVKRDALMRACEEEGPGTLVHPWLGKLNVSLAAPVEFAHSASSRGMVTFSLSFVEVPEEEKKGYALHNPALAAIEAAAAVAEAVKNFDLAFFLRPVAEAALALAHSWALALSDFMAPVYAAAQIFPVIADSVAVFVAAAVSAGNSIASVVKGFFPERAYSASDDGGAEAFSEGAALLRLALETPVHPVPSEYGTSRRQTANNRKAVYDFQREMLAARGLEAVAYAEPASSAEARELKTLALKTLDYVLENSTSDEFSQKIIRAGNYALDALSEAARRAPQIVRLTLDRLTPAYPLMWRVQPDGADLTAASDDFIARNRVPHPGFVPAGAAEALVR